jgi:hypothetical protein
MIASTNTRSSIRTALPCPYTQKAVTRRNRVAPPRVGMSYKMEPLLHFFRLNHQLSFLHGRTKSPVDEHVHVTIEGDAGRHKFALTKDGQELVSIEYEVPKSLIPPEVDFTQTESEHFDLFLFVTNMLEDPSRRRFAMGFPEPSSISTICQVWVAR